MSSGRVDDLPESARSLAAKPKRIFFSYGHDANRPIVERLKRDLEARGHRVWIDYDRIGTWDDWRGRITQGIQESEMAVAFLSVHSVRNPGVCRNEIAMALQRFGRVYPLLVEELDSTHDLPITLEHLQWPDLSRWRDIGTAGEGQGVFERYYQNKLAEVIDKIEGDASRFREEISFLEAVLQPVSFEGRYRQHVEGFTGRQWLFDALANWMQPNAASRVFWLSAGPGFGKTAWAVNVAVRNPATVVGAWFCEQGSRESLDAGRALSTLAFQMAQRLDDYRSLLIARLAKAGASLGPIEPSEVVEQGSEEDEGADAAGAEASEPAEDSADISETGSSFGALPNASALRALIQAQSLQDIFALLFSEPMSGMIPRSHKYVILLDALDEANLPDGTNPLAELLDSHLLRLPDWFCAIVTSRPDPAVVDRLGRFSPVEVKAMDEKNLEDLRAYASKSLEGAASLQVPGTPEMQTLIESLVRKSGGMILYLQRIAEGLKQGSLKASQLDDLGTGVAGLESFYLRDFQHRFANGFEKSYQPLLRLILSAPGQLSLGFAAAIFGDLEVVRRACIHLGSYLNHEGGQVLLYHKTLADWLSGERSSVFFTDIAKGRKQIAEFLWKCFTERDRDSPNGKVTLVFEKEMLAWMPDLLPLLPQWRRAQDLRAFGEFLNTERAFQVSVAISGRAYRMRKREKGANHPFTLNAGRIYGVALRETGDLKAAEPILRTVLKGRMEKLGKTEKRTLQSMEDLAKCLQKSKAYEECAKIRRKLVELRSELHGPNATATQTALFRLGDTENMQGHKAEALEIYYTLLKIREAELGFADRSTLRLANRITVIQRDGGDLESARDLARRMVDAMVGNFTASDPDFLANRSLLGNIEEKLGNLESAGNLYRTVLEIREGENPNAATTILSLVRLGNLLLKMGKTPEAVPLLERAWKSRGGIKEPNDDEGLSLLNNLAIGLNRTGRRKEAMQLLHQHLAFFEAGKNTLLYNLACYECLEGHRIDAMNHIKAFLSQNPDWRKKAMDDPDLETLRDFLQNLELPSRSPDCIQATS